MITGGWFKTGSGTKDSTLNGFQWDHLEFVGQSAGLDQVVIGTDGKIKSGQGHVTIDRDGIEILGGTSAGSIIEWKVYDGIPLVDAAYLYGDTALLAMGSYGASSSQRAIVQIQATDYTVLSPANAANPLIQLTSVASGGVGDILLRGDVRVSTSSGYVDVGPANTSYSHFQTDRPSFYFNKRISVDENIITSYDGDFLLQRMTSTKLTLTSTGATVTGGITADSMYITTGSGLGIGTAATAIDNIKIVDSFSSNGTRTSINSLVTLQDGTLTANRTHYGIINEVRNNYVDADAYTNAIYGTYSRVRNSTTDNGQADIQTAYVSYNHLYQVAGVATKANIYTGYGTFNYLQMYRAGNATNWYGTYDHIHVQAGTIATAYGNYIRLNRDGGTLTTAYGIYLSFEGTIGTKWGIRSVGETKSQLDGALGLGVDPGAYKLSVTGNSYFTGDQTVTGIMSVGGTLLVPTGGSVTTPAISFSGDANTGFYRWAVDSWSLVAGGNSIISMTPARIGLNQELGDWVNLSLGSGWTNHGSAFNVAQYKKVGDLVFLRGMVTASSWSTTPILATMPENFRPLAQVMYACMGNANATVRIDVEAGGALRWVSGGAGTLWISLSNIVFSVA